MKIAVCPGSFDPITKGHLDIITRAGKLFDQLIILVSVNQEKHPIFSLEERLDLINTAVAHMQNVHVDILRDGLLADYVRQVGACAIVKGLRAVSDFEYEFQMALANKRLYPNAETIFLTASSEHMYLSSSLVKQIAGYGGNIADFVPESVAEKISQRLKRSVVQ
ncbi:MAG TPA: pantetheine-phosphate adenylyltransferase [Firmicutes bacterium]|nr:pantetheine-phosphate adenylyltransferase [Bacillota bacterium]